MDARAVNQMLVAEPLEREILDFITMVPEDRTHKLLVARGWTPPAEPLRDVGAAALAVAIQALEEAEDMLSDVRMKLYEAGEIDEADVSSWRT